MQHEGSLSSRGSGARVASITVIISRVEQQWPAVESLLLLEGVEATLDDVPAWRARPAERARIQHSQGAN